MTYSLLMILIITYHIVDCLYHLKAELFASVNFIVLSKFIYSVVIHLFDKGCCNRFFLLCDMFRLVH